MKSKSGKKESGSRVEQKEKNKKISIQKSLEIESSKYKRKVKEIF